ncbi:MULTISPECIES: LytR/AlgR family response regulator transcription factor [Mucilaginibacter]|uniref:LytR/AlgR family response regulator transcription factor n=1 Tax=Mucilaginibacter TaxID=423349 RepID=UPI000871A521|nr:MULTISPECIES: LytTR family DNA-binding domain-containing protein [Mucilaginibacter]NVM64097.1 DNA-binding LytR/AlgR family response regulator [Mucilaginibacter sp. SG538B]GGB23349.1 DNA-binding response regulator [Mucilaginibacter rubeus]SCW71386.1 two component transcriptional regulator, LytTR family [Mucilaginibacter sp. NFR10]
MNLSCIIIDDEPNAVNLLEILVQQSTQWQLKAKCYNALEALAFLKTNKVDFIFLDINMPQLTGMELAGLLPPQTKIVFTTAYSEYAAESYTYQTIDYLLKPITLKRFLAAMQKIEAYFGKSEPVMQQTPVNEGYFFIKSGKVLRRILLDEILYFEGEKEYVRLVTSQEQLLIYRRLKDIEEQLSAPFVRVHNSYIVNTKQLVKIQDNHIYIADKHIPVSEKFKDSFMKLINRRIF